MIKEKLIVQRTAMQIAAEINNFEFLPDEDSGMINYNLRSGGRYGLELDEDNEGAILKHYLEFHSDHKTEEQVIKDLTIFLKEKSVLENLLGSLGPSNSNNGWWYYSSDTKKIQGPTTTHEIREELEKYKSNIQKLEELYETRI